VVVAIIAILVSLLLPSLGKARYVAKSAVCLSNQKQIYTGFTLVAKNNKGKFPQMSSMMRNYWDTQGSGGVKKLLEKGFSKDVFSCTLGKFRYTSNATGSKTYTGYGFWYKASSSGEMANWAHATPNNMALASSGHLFMSDIVTTTGGREDYRKATSSSVGTAHFYRGSVYTFNSVYADGHGKSAHYKSVENKFHNGWGDHWYAQKQPTE